MFDMESFNLQNSILKARQTELLESSKEEANLKKLNLENFLETLSSQYESMQNNRVEGTFSKIRLAESATIHTVRDVMYEIFESALLLDESAKDYYRDTIRGIFNETFAGVLKENNVTSLSEFKDYIKESHHMLGAIVETAHQLNMNTADIYSELLETSYNSSYIGNKILETYGVFAEADVAQDDKLQSVKALAKNIVSQLQDISTGERIGVGEAVRQLVIFTRKLVSEGCDIKDFGSNFSLTINLYLTTIQTAAGKDNHTRFVPGYRSELAAVKNELIVLLQGMNNDNPLYNKAQTLLERLDKVLASADYMSVVVDRDSDPSLSAILEADSEDVDDATIEKLKKDVEETIKNESQPVVEKIRKLKLYREAVMRRKVTPAIFILIHPLISLVFYLVRKSRLNASTAKEMLKEAERTLDLLKKKSSEAKSKGDSKSVKRFERDITRLERLISRYEEIFAKQYGKAVREEATPMTELVTNLNEAAQYLMIYEASQADMQYILNLVQESVNTEEDSTDREILLTTLQRNACTEGNYECACMEEALYNQIHAIKPEGLSETAHQRLQEGQLPSEIDFLDDAEKDLVTSVATMNGKDRAVDIIKNKVVTVIEKEEERTKKRDEEEQEILNKMSPEDVNNLKNDLQESSGRMKIGSIRPNMPTTLFESIVMNRSKKYIQEAVSSGDRIDISSNRETILSESLVLYTMYETFNTLKFVDYDTNKVDKLMNQYYYQ